MRIAVVIERIEAWRGGSEISTMQFVRHLAARGCEVTVITASRGSPAPGMRIHHVAVRSPLRARRTAVFARKVAAHLRRESFDVVHAVTPIAGADVYQPRGGLLAETERQNLAMRTTTATRGLKRLSNTLNGKQRIMSRLERTLLTRQPPPMVVAVSQYVGRQLTEHYGLSAPHVRVIFNAVEFEPAPEDQRQEDAQRIRDQFRVGPDELLLLLVGHNFRLKGVGALIAAMATLQARDVPVTVLIVGRDNPIRFRRQAVAAGLGNRVIFTGPTQRIRAFYHAADALVHPTYYDPCSRVVLEALCAGLPCITTAFNGAAEVMTEGHQGYVIDSPDNTAALADRIARLADPVHRAACATAAEQLREQLSMKRQVDEWLTLYRDMIDGNHRP
jgi:UDP-glucose:(heptosyl)LPS alpha-1,3-glucosyltransferase